MAQRRAFLFLFVLSFLSIVQCCPDKENNDNEQLRDALEMIYRRQNEMKPRDDTVYLNSRNSYLSDDSAEDDLTNTPNNLVDFYPLAVDGDDEVNQPYEGIYSENDFKLKPKRTYSVFRERSDEHKSAQMPHLSRNQIFEDEDNSDSEESDYMRLLEDYWQRYRAERNLDELRRAYAVQRYLREVQPDKPKRNIYKRTPTDTIIHLPYLHHTDNIVLRKRFPLTKRSSDFSDDTTQKQVPKTDPKVEDDLSQIFGSNNDKTKTGKTPKKVQSSTINGKKNATVSKLKDSQKETVFYPNQQPKHDHINIRKKSIDWSNYFGIDKRSFKSPEHSQSADSNQIDDWMLQRYNTVIKKLAGSDDSENNDSMEIEGGLESRDEKQRRSDESKLDVIKNKLKNIEDMIIDEALKYTGAHEGETDSKEVQQVKDKVMSRLATVYSLEKMRRALGEFKKSIAEQRQKLKENQLNGDFDVLKTDDEDSTSITSTTSATPSKNDENNGVPVKKSRSDTDNKDDNNISRHSSAEESTDDCEVLHVIDRKCSHLAAKLGEQLIQPLCTLHQICTLCGAHEPIQQTNQYNFIEDTNTDLACYYLYMTQSEHACAGETQCRRRANFALNELRDLSNNENAYDSPPPAVIRTEEFCPQSAVCVGSFLETAKRRLSFSPYIMGRHNI